MAWMRPPVAPSHATECSIKMGGWWRPQLRRLFDRLRLDRFFALKSAMQWVHGGGGGLNFLCIFHAL